MKTLLNSQKGVTTTEFLFSFPVFLTAALLTLEVCFMSADRHLLELATFEAGRILSQGRFDEDPCSAEATEEARLAIVRRMSLVSPGIGLMAGYLGESSLSENYVQSIRNKGFNKLVEKSLENLPASAVSVKINCNHDPAMDTLTLDVNYYRSSKMPLIGNILFSAYGLSEFLEKGSSINDMVTHLKKMTMSDPIDTGTLFEPLYNLHEKNLFLEPENLFSQTLEKWKQLTMEMINKIEAEMDTSATNEEQLEFIVNNLPDLYKKIPLKSNMIMARSLKGADMSLVEGKYESLDWRAKIDGIISMDGEFREWAMEMSVDHQNDLATGKSL